MLKISLTPTQRMEDQQSLVGLCLTGEAETSSDHIVGAIHLPPSSRTEKLSTCRTIVRSALPESLRQKHLVFLTSRGWEINEDLEKVVKISDVITAEGLIRIRLAYSKPRVGIVIEGEPDFPVGFVFCDVGSTIEEFFSEIERQLPSLFQALATRTASYAVLDRNGWPISHDQEKILTVLEVLASNSVKIRCAQQQNRRISRGHDYPDSVDAPGPVHSCIKYVRSNSDPLASTSQLQFQSLSLPLRGEAQRSLSPVREIMEATPESSLGQSNTNYSEIDYPLPTKGDDYKFEILLSYVHSEASECALVLKESLQQLGYTVFLDVHCIQGGADWQDALNDAISNCSLFVPLITMQYGETLWTNREVKLADVLGKMIIPVNFLSNWPPKCLAIQFATTQFIRVPFKSQTEDLERIMEQFDKQLAGTVASDISNRYQGELKTNQANAAVDQRVFSDGDDKTELSRQDTVDMCDSASTPLSAASSTTFSVPLNLSRKQSMLKSYASTLPRTLPEHVRQSIVESRVGKPLVAISCTIKEKEFVQRIVQALSSKDYEVWCSCDIDPSLGDDAQRAAFQSKVDEAGVVVFILSKEFASSTFCEQQVYYCEQRKRIVPVIYESMQMPNWMAMLIGTSTFVHCKSESYLQTIVERVDLALDNKKSQQELQSVLKQKTELMHLCSKLTGELPAGKHVYISGSTIFYSNCGKEICEELGKQLAQDHEIILITGGFYGVGDTVAKSFFDERTRLSRPHGLCHIVAERDDQDKSHQTRQRPDRTFEPVPYGDTLFYGDSVRQREMLTPRVIDLCILVEGGPGAAFEAQQFIWNGNRVIPIKVTGGAAGGSFNVPPAILIRPPGVPESDWSLLGDKSASPSSIASAVVRTVQILKNSKTPLSAISRSRSNTGDKLKLMDLKRSQMLSRRETLPESFDSRDNPADILRRTSSLSDKHKK